MRIFLILACSIFFSIPSFSQPGDPNTNPDVPITGIEVLIGLGGALGAKKLFKRKKTTNS